MVAKTRKAVKRSTLRLQTFWTGNPLSRLERAALMSYVNVGYTIHVYTYNPIKEFMKHVPGSPHIKVLDAREILPESALFKYSGRTGVGKRDDAFSYLPFSDLFRFTMLQKKGGAWIDLDIFLVRPIAAKVLNRPYALGGERTIQKGAYKKAEPEVPTVSFIKVPGPNSELMNWILERLPTGGRLVDIKSPFDYMNLFRKGIEALGLEKYVLPAYAFLSLNWWDVKDSFAAGAGLAGTCYKGKYGTAPFCVDHLKRPDVYGIHWFRAILRKKNLPYERADTERRVEDNLYEQMVSQIERDAGLAKDSL
jgi:hypothetical protein